MLQALFIGAILGLFKATAGQAEVPIQANFDASQVCSQGPSLAMQGLGSLVSEF